MANAKKKATEYDDDDEINKSLREFNEQQRKAEEAAKAAAQAEEQEPPEQTDNDDEGFGITAKNKAPDFVGPMTEEDINEQNARVLMTCSCCDKEWTLRGSMLNRPACSCPMYPTCNECGHCRNHCKCKALVAARQAKAAQHEQH